MNAKSRNGLIRLGVLFAAIAVGTVVGVVASSVGAFVAVLAAGLVANILLRFTVLR